MDDTFSVTASAYWSIYNLLALWPMGLWLTGQHFKEIFLKKHELPEFHFLHITSFGI